MSAAPRPSRLARAAKWWKSASQANRIAIAVPLATTLVAGVVSIVVAVVPAVLNDNDTLSLVDVSIRDLEQGKYTADIDVNVRSTGDEVSYIKGVELEILDSRRIDSCIVPLPVPISVTYDIVLPAEAADLPQSIPYKLYHSIEPGKVDRFVLRLGTPGAGDNIVGATVYRFRLRIPYNEGSSTHLESDPLLAYVKYPYAAPIGTTGGGTDRDCVKRNARDLSDLAKTDGVRSAEFDSFVADYVARASKS